MPSLLLCNTTAIGIMTNAISNNINKTDRAMLPSFTGFALSLTAPTSATAAGPFSVPVHFASTRSRSVRDWLWSSGGTSGICSVSNSFKGSVPEDVLCEPSPGGVSAELRLLFAVSDGFFDASCLVEIRILGVLKEGKVEYHLLWLAQFQKNTKIIHLHFATGLFSSGLFRRYCMQAYKSKEQLRLQLFIQAPNTQPKPRTLKQVCWHLATDRYNKPISECVRIACDSLLTTSLLQVVNKLVASWLSKLVINRLATSCFNKL